MHRCIVWAVRAVWLLLVLCSAVGGQWACARRRVRSLQGGTGRVAVPPSLSEGAGSGWTEALQSANSQYRGCSCTCPAVYPLQVALLCAVLRCCGVRAGACVRLHCSIVSLRAASGARRGLYGLQAHPLSTTAAAAGPSTRPTSCSCPV